MTRPGFGKIKERFRELRLQAASESLEVNRDRLGFMYDIQPFHPSTQDVVAEQWTQEGFEPVWDWDGVLADHRDYKCWCFTLWAPEERLSALVACKVRNSYVEFTFLEGDPRPDCPLKPQRFLLALDAIVRYARLCGVGEVRCSPLNEKLANRYILAYGFEPVDPESWKVLRLILP